MLRHVQERGTIAKRQSPAMPVDFLWTVNSHMLVAYGAHSGLLPCLSWTLILVFFLGELTSGVKTRWVLPQLKAPGLASPPTQLRSKSIQV